MTCHLCGKYMRKFGEPEVLPSGYEDQVYVCKNCGYCWVKSEWVGDKVRQLELFEG